MDRVLGRIGRLDTHGLQTVIQRLARERTFLETLFNAIQDGVLVVDEHGRVIYFNHAVSDLLGWRDDMEGRPVSQLLPELDWESILIPAPNGKLRATHHEFEVAYPRSRFLRLYAAPLDVESKAGAGMALILHDATEARLKTQEAIESERAQALTLLAASVAHEIGNPLNALHIHLQLMGREIKRLREAAAGQTGIVGQRDVRPLAVPTEPVRKMEGYLEVAKG
jgi:two-component system, sporulation sensor kinase E